MRGAPKRMWQPMASRCRAAAFALTLTLALALALARPTVAQNITLRNITFSAYVYDFNTDHQDIERYGGSCELGTVMDELGPDRLPVFRGGWAVNTSPQGQYLTNQTGTVQCRSSAQLANGVPGTGGTGHAEIQTYFDEWFNAIPGHNVKVPVAITLTELASTPGTFQLDRTSSFFPLDGAGWGADMGVAGTRQTSNYGFAFQVHTEFVYVGNETFAFDGDDDVYVFLNNKLVVDLGGLHPARSDVLVLSTIAAAAGMVPGNRYNFDFFQVERHYSGSNCRITTTIQPTNQPPRASDGSFSLLVGERVDAKLPSFDIDTMTLVYTTWVPADLAPLITFGADGLFTFVAPISLGPVSTTVTYSMVFAVFDGEFSSCNATITFSVTQIVPPSPPPPGPAPIIVPSPSSPVLSKTAVTAIIVGASLIVLFAIIGVIALIIWLRSRMGAWESEFENLLNKDSAATNPLYKPAETEFVNPLFMTKDELK